MRRDEFGAHYEGVRVSWPVRFMAAKPLDCIPNFVPAPEVLEKIFGISEPREGCVLFLFYGHRRNLTTTLDCLACVVRVCDYPILNTLQENAPMWVEGKIFKCLDGALLLSGVVLQFL